MKTACFGGLVAGLYWLAPLVHSMVTVTIRVPAGVCNGGPSLPTLSGTATAIAGSIPGESLASPPPIVSASVSVSAAGTGTVSPSLITTSNLSAEIYTVSNTATQTIVITLVSVASSSPAHIQTGSLSISDSPFSGMISTSDNFYSSIASSGAGTLDPLSLLSSSSSLPFTSGVISVPPSITAPLVSSIVLASSTLNDFLTSTLTTSSGSSSSSRSQTSSSVFTVSTLSNVASSHSSNGNGISSSSALFSTTTSVSSSSSSQTRSTQPTSFLSASVIYTSSSSQTGAISTGSGSAVVQSGSSSISQTDIATPSLSLSRSTSSISISSISSGSNPTSLPAIPLTVITTTTTFTTTTITPGESASSTSLMSASRISSPSSASSSSSSTATSSPAAASSSAAASTYVASSTYALKLSNPTPLVNNCGSSGVDESQYGITLPFIMDLFDQSGTDLTITTNGLFSIADNQSTYIADVDNSIPPPENLPSYEITPPAAFVWWEYLLCSATYPQGIYYQFDDSGNEISIEWLLEDADGLVYQFLANYDANEAGIISFYYFSSGDGGANATIGVEGYDNDQGQVIAVQYEAGQAQSVYPGLLLQINTNSGGSYNVNSFNTSCIPAGSFPAGTGC